jgi:hypothetical protein
MNPWTGGAHFHETGYETGNLLLNEVRPWAHQVRGIEIDDLQAQSMLSSAYRSSDNSQAVRTSQIAPVLEFGTGWPPDLEYGPGRPDPASNGVMGMRQP